MLLAVILMKRHPKSMATRGGGPTASGTDGNDYSHRETIVAQYYIRPPPKSQPKGMGYSDDINNDPGVYEPEDQHMHKSPLSYPDTKDFIAQFMKTPEQHNPTYPLPPQQQYPSQPCIESPPSVSLNTGSCYSNVPNPINVPNGMVMVPANQMMMLAPQWMFGQQGTQIPQHINVSTAPNSRPVTPIPSPEPPPIPQPTFKDTNLPSDYKGLGGPDSVPFRMPKKTKAFNTKSEALGVILDPQYSCNTFRTLIDILVLGLFPVLVGFAANFSELYRYASSKDIEKVETWNGFPVSVLWSGNPERRKRILWITYNVSGSIENIPSRNFTDYQLIRVNATPKFAQKRSLIFGRKQCLKDLCLWIFCSAKKYTRINRRGKRKNDVFDETDFEGRPIQDVRWNKYYDLEVMNDYLEKLKITYPFKKFHKSGRNRQNKRIFIDGGVHAREWISPAVALYIIYLLVERHEDNSKLINDFEWLIVPMVNPDGYAHSRTRNRMWRKSRRNNGKGKCYGVDLNRNFGFHWKEGLQVKDLSNPCSEIYAGPTPFSEPETKAIEQTILNYNKTIIAYFSLHSYSQLWTFPWSYKLPDRESSKYYDLYTAAKKAVNSLESLYGTNYVFGSSSELSYLSSGTSDDWMYGVAGIKYSFTIELRDEGKYGFLLPSSQIVPTAEETFAGISALIADICDK
ncbi:Carboxypeptidase B,Carboxypeptidase O,Mast cell carboxypeptidase A,Carboxypeptidase A2,Carboxypeptidase A1,Carboxypeptidase B2,Carboxypeptidase A5 [Lepeophtheirus salmonis]|uniref:Carboxypeptidase B,Carboxypeptidase O,Mast cell carboxypeptidase A,Carboxypeptidase A2,Carboxypeptidase A1,Carboxypeptidase B2,Carboxypeptidase A5 n=1 Tax=Lepeophtheirus salmonis TaxID=72036 RepID=A0A7R8CEJ7_LEPSM|nr:Carboxypeptidase B,Carboxypeptidase O,Mast cell carboxypeptidase A,Carboxypeptidase A2,Carboxypeptidase A1,Carboxypeptidase B2,Carboxypeptidase A5 [Lepeophtheirus salmonis]CAF2796235.1 Carboxypeptidase B,Carboxypeptidase O,Mast cell carboxypeptidase A,Carboxypeptidase A2,Carboxypeptidase A1,Carboxypeptidase B2,Carboxypeptidase A5 [Lepeophtheirus salmonis]